MGTELGMESQFIEKELGECLELVIDHRGKTPKKLGADWVDSGIPTISAKNVNGGRLIATDEIRHVSHDVYKRWMKEDVKRGDCFLVSEGATLGECMMWDYDYPIVLGQRIFCLRANPSLLYPRYLYAYMTSASFQSEIIGRATGTSVDGLRQTEVLKLKLRLPPLTQQRQIGDTLYNLDKKIELNRRMNATLESMARALFQSWFVDFDPVRAKLDGPQADQPTALDPATAALFPDSFEDSELGHLPRGWKVGRVADVSDFRRSSINPSEFHEETFDHYSLPAFDEGRTPKAELGSAIMSNKLVVTLDSVLLSKLNPHIPRIWRPDLHTTRRSVCSTEFIVASTQPGYSREFLFSLFTSAAFASTYGTLVTGTTGSHQRIRAESVVEMKTVIPPPKLVEAFTTAAKPMFDQINRNLHQSRTLATLRDTLLPKLLSGELSVAGATQAMEQA